MKIVTRPRALFIAKLFCAPHNFKTVDGTAVRLKDVKYFELEDIKLAGRRNVTGSFNMHENLYHSNNRSKGKTVQWIFSFTLSEDLQTIERYLELNRDKEGKVLHSEEYSDGKLVTCNGTIHTGTCRLV